MGHDYPAMMMGWRSRRTDSKNLGLHNVLRHLLWTHKKWKISQKHDLGVKNKISHMKVALISVHINTLINKYFVQNSHFTALLLKHPVE